MKKQTQWQRHVETWHESGLSQADYCRQQGLNRKTFSARTRRVQVDLSLDRRLLISSAESMACRAGSAKPRAKAL